MSKGRKKVLIHERITDQRHVTEKDVKKAGVLAEQLIDRDMAELIRRRLTQKDSAVEVDIDECSVAK